MPVYNEVEVESPDPGIMRSFCEKSNERSNILSGDEKQKWTVQQPPSRQSEEVLPSPVQLEDPRLAVEGYESYGCKIITAIVSPEPTNVVSLRLPFHCLRWWRDQRNIIQFSALF